MNLLTPAEVANRVKLTPRSVVQLCKRGKLPGAVQLGRYWRVPNPRSRRPA